MSQRETTESGPKNVVRPDFGIFNSGYYIPLLVDNLSAPFKRHPKESAIGGIIGVAAGTAVLKFLAPDEFSQSATAQEETIGDIASRIGVDLGQGLDFFNPDKAYAANLEQQNPSISIGGSGFGIGTGPNGEINTSWQDGLMEMGYKLTNLTSRTTTVFPVGGGLLPATSNSFTLEPSSDRVAGVYLEPMRTNNIPLGRSDFLLAIKGIRTAVGSPENFIIRLNQGRIASFELSGPVGGGQDSYVLFKLGANKAQILSADATSTIDDTEGTLSCYILAVRRAASILGFSDVLCGLPGFTTLSSNLVIPSPTLIRATETPIPPVTVTSTAVSTETLTPTATRTAITTSTATISPSPDFTSTPSKTPDNTSTINPTVKPTETPFPVPTPELGGTIVPWPPETAKILAQMKTLDGLRLVSATGAPPDEASCTGACYRNKPRQVWFVGNPTSQEKGILAHEVGHAHQHWQTEQAGIPFITQPTPSWLQTLHGQEFKTAWDSFKADLQSKGQPLPFDNGYYENFAIFISDWYEPVNTWAPLTTNHPSLKTFADKWHIKSPA